MTASRQNSTLLEAALDYATNGIPVFPCRADNKSPHLKRGFKDASTDEAAIGDWWSRWPDAMVACPTGQAIGAWVLDVDDPVIFEAAAAQIGLSLPVTRRASTGKGYHLYFRYDPAAPVHNRQRAASGWPFPRLPGAETRGEGGYVILPPSLHPTGKSYEWKCEEDVSEAPAELLAIVRGPKTRAMRDNYVPRIETPSGEDSRYGLRALEEECRTIMQAPSGTQEMTLNSAGLKIGALVAGGELRMQTAESRLVAAGMSMSSHHANHPWDATLIRAKVQRALSDGAAQPRSAPALRIIQSAPARGNSSRPGERFEASDGSSGHADQTRPVVQIRAGELHIMASRAEAALVAARAPLYVRGGLVRPVVDETAAADGQRTKIARLVPVDANTLIDHLSRSIQWEKFDKREQSWVAANPPINVAHTMLARDGEWTFPPLAGVITAPTIRSDGSLLCEPGYDSQTGLLLCDPPKLPPFPASPSKEEAAQALAKLDLLLDGFPFADAASRSVALSGLITPIVRGAMPVAPLHAITAPVAGSGKSYLVDLVSAILTGDSAPVIAVGQTQEETEKRLASALLSGQPIVSIDNVNGRLGGDLLCQLIERPVVAVRPLGVSKLVRIQSRATSFATGNNIQLVDDMTRRAILCTLNPNVERPELRQFKTDPRKVVMSDRGAYIAAALTVVRAYVAAGFPDRLPRLASFEAWSDFVRSALVWLGRADPVETMEAARADDPELSTLGALLAAWSAVAGSEGRTVGDIIKTAEMGYAAGNLIHADLMTAMQSVADDHRGRVNSLRLGHYLKAHRGRIVGGLRFDSVIGLHSKQLIWRVVKS